MGIPLFSGGVSNQSHSENNRQALALSNLAEQWHWASHLVGGGRVPFLHLWPKLLSNDQPNYVAAILLLPV